MTESVASLFSGRTWLLRRSTELPEKLEDTVKVRQSRTVTIDEFTERVLAVDIVFSIFECLAGNAGKEFSMYFCQRLSGLAARNCQLRVGIPPGLEFGCSLSLLLRNLIQQFGEQFAGLLLQHDHVAEQAGRLARVTGEGSRLGGRGTSGRDIDLRRVQRSVGHEYLVDQAAVS